MLKIIDDFIKNARSITVGPSGPMWAQHVHDLEAVLRALFVSDDSRAIEMSDQIRDVIGRKRVALEKRLRMLEQILRESADEWTTKWSPTGSHE